MSKFAMIRLGSSILILACLVSKSSPDISVNYGIKHHSLRFKILELKEGHLNDFEIQRTRTSCACRKCRSVDCAGECKVGIARIRGGSSKDGKQKWSVAMQDGKYVVLAGKDTGVEYQESRRVLNVSYTIVLDVVDTLLPYP